MTFPLVLVELKEVVLLSFTPSLQQDHDALRLSSVS